MAYISGILRCGRDLLCQYEEDRREGEEIYNNNNNKKIKKRQKTSVLLFVFSLVYLLPGSQVYYITILCFPVIVEELAVKGDYLSR